MYSKNKSSSKKSPPINNRKTIHLQHFKANLVKTLNSNWLKSFGSGGESSNAQSSLKSNININSNNPNENCISITDLKHFDDSNSLVSTPSTPSGVSLLFNRRENKQLCLQAAFNGNKKATFNINKKATKKCLASSTPCIPVKFNHSIYEKINANRIVGVQLVGDDILYMNESDDEQGNAGSHTKDARSESSKNCVQKTFYNTRVSFCKANASATTTTTTTSASTTTTTNIKAKNSISSTNSNSSTTNTSDVLTHSIDVSVNEEASENKNNNDKLSNNSSSSIISMFESQLSQADAAAQSDSGLSSLNSAQLFFSDITEILTRGCSRSVVENSKILFEFLPSKDDNSTSLIKYVYSLYYLLVCLFVFVCSIF